MSHLSTVPLGAHPSRNQPIYRGVAYYPTGSRSTLFLTGRLVS
jgi:hypothetical protein